MLCQNDFYVAPCICSDVSRPSPCTVIGAGLAAGWQPGTLVFRSGTAGLLTSDDSGHFWVVGQHLCRCMTALTLLVICTKQVEGSLMEGLREWRRKAALAVMDYGFHMAVTSWSDQVCLALQFGGQSSKTSGRCVCSQQPSSTALCRRRAGSATKFAGHRCRTQCLFISLTSCRVPGGIDDLAQVVGRPSQSQSGTSPSHSLPL